MLRRRQAVLFFDDDADASWQWAFVGGVTPSEIILAVVLDNAAVVSVSSVFAVGVVADVCASVVVDAAGAQLVVSSASLTASAATASVFCAHVSSTGLIGILDHDVVPTVSDSGATLEVHHG